MAAHPQDPEKFLVLLIDALRRDPAQLGALSKAFDEAIGHTRPTVHRPALERCTSAGLDGDDAAPLFWG